MKNTLITAAASIVALAGPVLAGESRTFDLPEFDRIDASAGVIVVAEVGAAQSVEV